MKQDSASVGRVDNDGVRTAVVDVPLPRMRTVVGQDRTISWWGRLHAIVVVGGRITHHDVTSSRFTERPRRHAARFSHWLLENYCWCKQIRCASIKRAIVSRLFRTSYYSLIIRLCFFSFSEVFPLIFCVGLVRWISQFLSVFYVVHVLYLTTTVCNLLTLY